jgi:putative membrane protein
MKQAILAGAFALLATPLLAQAQSLSPQPPSPQPAQQPAANPPAPAQAAPPSAANTPSTADFVKNAAIAGMFEIQSSELALRKHIRPDRQFAEKMIHDHERFAAQLKHIVAADHVDAQVPTQLDQEHQKMLDQLRGESGSSFDKDYDQMQQQGHQQAVSLFQSYSQNGDNAALKQWAAKTLPELEDHLNMAEKLS